jgi:hypothetical protein
MLFQKLLQLLLMALQSCLQRLLWICGLLWIGGLLTIALACKRQ